MTIDSTTTAPDLAHRLAAITRQVPEGIQIIIRRDQVTISGHASTWGRIAEISAYAHSLVTWAEGDGYALMLTNRGPGRWTATLFTTDENYYQITGRTNASGLWYDLDGVHVSILPYDSWMELAHTTPERPF